MTHLQLADYLLQIGGLKWIVSAKFGYVKHPRRPLPSFDDDAG
jgi:hypothetical protein